MLRLANHYAAAGYEVDYLVAAAAGPYRSRLASGVRLVDFNRRRVGFCLAPLAAYLCATRPSVLITGMNHANFVAVAAARLARRQTPVVCSIRRITDPATDLGFIRRTAIRWWLPRAAAVVAISQGVRDDLIHHFGPPAARTIVIHNPAYDETSATARRPPAIPLPGNIAGRPLLVAIGRLQPVKGFSVLIRALAQLRASGLDVALAILGEGPERPSLEALARDLQLDDVVWMPGFVDDPYPYLRLASCVVVSSTSEGFCNVLVEALGAGAPIVSTDCPGGPSEILEGGRLGVLCRVGDAAAMASAIIDAMGRSWDAGAKRARASDFDVRHIARRYLHAAGLAA